MGPLHLKDSLHLHLDLHQLARLYLIPCLLLCLLLPHLAMIDDVAIARKHIKFELPRLSKFSHISAHLRAWLVCIHEHLLTIGVEQNVWVVFAAF